MIRPGLVSHGTTSAPGPRSTLDLERRSMTRDRARRLLAAVVLAASFGCRHAPRAGTPSAAAPTGAAASVAAHKVRYRGDFHALLGVQLWSFREQAKPDPVAMLQLVRRMGFTHVETAGLYGMPAAQLADAVRRTGLQVTSMHVGYDELKNDPQAVIANAQAVGARYVGIAWHPHQGAFTEADARRAVADFNAFGHTLKAAALTFFYHNHGYEPARYGDGTLYDLIVRETDPALFAFELDVLRA